jgi:type III secretion protein C
MSLGMSFATQAMSAEQLLSGKKFVYRADGKRINEVFEDFAAAESVPIVIDRGVEGVVNAEFNARPEDFLAGMSKTYNLVWYFDGVTLFIYPSSAMSSKLFRMKGYGKEEINAMLRSMELGDNRFPLRFNQREQTVMVYGPPRHLELLQTVIDTLDQGARSRASLSIRIFPLKYASAGDRVTGDARIPGLATTLNNLFGDGKQISGDNAQVREAKQAASNAIYGSPEKLKAMQSAYGAGRGGSNGGKNDLIGATLKNAADAADANDPNRRSNGEGPDAEKPFFQAEEGSNSIIVRGDPKRMGEYESLIRQLDVRQDLIEIEATIIDVSSDAFDSLGIDWNLTGSRGSVNFTPGAGAAASTGSTSSGVGGLVPNITTIINDGGRALMARIRALEGKGKAKVLARPKVLGSANRTAVMSDKRTASVRVAGNLDANLFTIEAGTTLQVLPQIIPGDDNGASREVRLTLYIEDGNFEGQVVDSVPIIKHTEIRTEAAIKEGESILIGGISVESTAEARAGVPLLSSIPGIGGLFRYSESSGRRSERMFLITPKLANKQPPALAQIQNAPVPATGLAGMSALPNNANAAAAVVPVPVAVPARATPSLAATPQAVTYLRPAIWVMPKVNAYTEAKNTVPAVVPAPVPTQQSIPAATPNPSAYNQLAVANAKNSASAAKAPRPSKDDSNCAAYALGFAQKGKTTPGCGAKPGSTATASR